MCTRVRFDEFLRKQSAANPTSLNRPLKIVTVYSSMEDFLRANCLVEKLAARLAGVQFEHSPWHSHLFSARSLFHIALLEAAAADVLILAASKSEQDTSIKLWIESALALPAGQGRALVALLRFDKPEADENSVCDQLEQAARQHGLAFFCQSIATEDSSTIMAEQPCEEPIVTCSRSCDQHTCGRESCSELEAGQSDFSTY